MIAVIGAGPAGLMAAEVASAAGLSVTVLDRMPTPARKFLMAGKSGLNLTMDEPLPTLASHYAGMDGRDLLHGFGAAEVVAWARGLGIELFTGSTGRVFPREMKAAPLLRAWLARLAAQGVRLNTRWRWTGWDGAALTFATPDGPRTLTPSATILALGGASWPRLGSDAAWVPWLRDAGVTVAPFRPANMGFRVDWSPAMTRHFGAPVKGTALTAAGQTTRGEWVITRHGLEGGGIYALSAPLRDRAPATLDLAPDLSLSALTQRLRQGTNQSIGNRLRRALGDPIRAALLLEWGRPLPADPAALAALAKALPLRHTGPMGLDRAISSAGGITAVSLTPDLELIARPRTFACGEMLDWEAPTGGYLLTACLATGRIAGAAAARLARPAVLP